MAAPSILLLLWVEKTDKMTFVDDTRHSWLRSLALSHFSGLYLRHIEIHRILTMKKPFLQATALVLTVALLPATTSAISAVDANTYREMEQFYERV